MPVKKMIKPEYRQPIGIIAAVEGEVKELKKNTLKIEEGNIGKRTYLRGKIKGKELVIAKSGAGISKAKSLATEMVDKFSPRVIISTGSCGALQEQINTEDVIIGDEILFKQGGISEGERNYIETFLPDEVINKKVYDYLKGSSHFSVHLGRIISINKFIYQKKTKEELYNRYTAIAVEMESGGIAQVAKEKGIPFIAAKVVSDDLRGKLADYNKIADYNGNLVLKKMAPYFLTKPWETLWAVKFYFDLQRVYKKLYELQNIMLEVI